MTHLIFFLENIILGIGLSMDAFSISLANGLSEPKMKFSKVALVAAFFAIPQFLMPLIGWTCVHTVAEHFIFFRRLIPWIALLLLSYLGANMLFSGIKNGYEREVSSVNLGALFITGIATSVDTLSVGFTISAYNFAEALGCALTIGIVTFLFCIAGVLIGKRFGKGLANKAEILGGAILIFIGIEIFISYFLRG